MNTSISAGPDVGAWYALYAPRLRSAARRILGNDRDAEDATQDAFLAAFRFRDRYHAPSDPYPWLHRIATRKALSLAAAHRLPPVELAEDAAVVPSAEDEALASGESKRVIALVLHEPATAMHVLGGFRFHEIGARLGIPTASAGTRVRRGKQRIRYLLSATNPQTLESKTA